MLDKEALQYMVGLADDPEYHLTGPDGVEHTYTARKLTLVKQPLAQGLRFGSLTGLVDYLMSGLDAVQAEEVVLHVCKPDAVLLLGPLNQDRQRECLAGAELMGKAFNFGHWYEHEEAMIGLQSMFVDTPERAQLLKCLGLVTMDEEATLGDDGVTQKVTARAGVALAERVELPSPVTLRPFRTFREVEQPASEFVLRVTGERRCVQVALFEADGGAWQLEAMQNVKEKLLELVPGAKVLA